MLAESNNLCRHLSDGEQRICFLPHYFNNITAVCQNSSKSLGLITQKASIFLFCQTQAKYISYDVGLKDFEEEYAARPLQVPMLFFAFVIWAENLLYNAVTVNKPEHKDMLLKHETHTAPGSLLCTESLSLLCYADRTSLKLWCHASSQISRMFKNLPQVIHEIY